MPFTYTENVAYCNIFDDFEKVDFAELSKDLPTRQVVEIMCLLTSKLYLNEKNFEVQQDTFNYFFKNLPSDIIDKTINYTNERIHFSTKRSGNRFSISIIEHVTILGFIQDLLEVPNELPSADDDSPDFKLTLFKSYLYSVQKTLIRTASSQKSNNNLTDIEIAKVSLPLYLPYHEVQSFKDVSAQAYKAIVFFEFCEKNIEFKKYLEAFLIHKDVSSWKNYVKIIINIQDSLYNSVSKNHIHVIKVSPNGPNANKIEFLNSLSLDVSSFKSSIDFLGLREKPLFKLRDYEYSVMSFNFFTDKIFQGIQFDFCKILTDTNASYKNTKIRDYKDFKTRAYANEFSENELFYKVMSACFDEKKFSYSASGKHLKTHLAQGEPDYYLRDKENIFIFEFKDVLFPAIGKYSNDFDTIFSTINKKLIKSANKPKGITQLVNSIKDVLNKSYNKFDQYDGEQVIFPILITTDESFNALGVNCLLNKEFNNQLLINNIDKDYNNIKDVVIISLDFLILFRSYFFEGNIKMHECILNYLKFIKTADRVIDRLLSFEEYSKAAILSAGSKIFHENYLKIMQILNTN